MLENTPTSSDESFNKQSAKSKLTKTATIQITIGITLIIFATIIAYIPALRSGFVWDDKALTENPFIRTGDGLLKIWTEPSAVSEYEKHYWPLVYSMFWIEYHLWGLNPFGYHLVNVLLHIANAIVLWLLLMRLKIKGAILASAIFALHPVHTESAAWVIERKDVLSCLFYFLSLLTFVHFYKNRKWIFYLLSVLLFVCAMLSKSITVTLPIAILLYLFWKNDRLRFHDFALLIPFFIISIVITLIDVLHYQQVKPIETDLFLIGRFLIASRAIWFYAGKLLLPLNLLPVYPKWEINTSSLWQYIFPFALILVLIVLGLKRKKLGKGPLLLILFFIITLLPILGFVNYGFMAHSFVADRFQYLASTGLIILFSSIVVSVAERLNKLSQWILSCIIVILLLVLGILTYNQTKIYIDTETLFRYTLSKNPNAWVAHAFIGNISNARGELDEAIVHYNEALRIDPQQAKIHNNLGVALFKNGKLDEAADHFCKAISIDPQYANAHYHLASCLAKQQNWDEAIKHYKEALDIRPDYTEAKQGLKAINDIKK